MINAVLIPADTEYLVMLAAEAAILLDRIWRKTRRQGRGSTKIRTSARLTPHRLTQIQPKRTAHGLRVDHEHAYCVVRRHPVLYAVVEIPVLVRKHNHRGA